MVRRVHPQDLLVKLAVLCRGVTVRRVPGFHTSRDVFGQFLRGFILYPRAQRKSHATIIEL